ncbi:MAG: MerR family transcriptional regulator [Burkholderiaceae bacterium]|nr:MerR family transcriptional regulator [Burkholderiaceae bacterium]
MVNLVERGPTAAPAPCLGITEACSQFGISLRAIRFYESSGLVAPKRINGQRVYFASDQRCLALIVRLKQIGCSLAEIRQLLRLLGLPRSCAACVPAPTTAQTESAISDLELRRDHVDAMLAELRRIRRQAARALSGHRNATAGSTREARRLHEGT